MGAAAAFELQIQAARSGDKRAAGRLISVIEDNSPEAVKILQAVYPQAHNTWITGLTGAPGVGKSTLADLLIGAWRAQGKRVALLAVDPTSPFTGGALLGDRIRLQHGSSSGVLVRSMATRGWLGGMARSTERVATLCAGLGYDEVLIETVGVGQSEVDIAATGDTTVVVVTPGWGDGVQVAKAGIMEIGDVFVVNKADRPGSADAMRELDEMLHLAPADGWQPPVVATTATSGDGLDELVGALQGHRAAVESDAPQGRVEKRRRHDFQRAVADSVEGAVQPLLAGPEGARLLAEVGSGAIDPWAAAETLIANALSAGS